jgi:hypothetical protein
VLTVRAAGVGAWRHPRQPHLPHQAAYPFAIHELTRHLEKYHHLAAAVKRVPGVFLIDQTTEQQIAFIDRPGFLLRINSGTGSPASTHCRTTATVSPASIHPCRITAG